MTPARAAALALLALLAGCSQEPQPAPSPSAVVTPTPSATVEETEEPVDDTSYVVFPEVEQLEVVLLCQADLEGEQLLRGELENGGSIQIRKLAGGKLHASALPSPEADPVGTNVPSDSSFTEEDGFLSGTSVMWLAGTENNITVEYRLRWDDTVPPCDI